MMNVIVAFMQLERDPSFFFLYSYSYSDGRISSVIANSYNVITIIDLHISHPLKFSTVFGTKKMKKKKK